MSIRELESDRTIIYLNDRERKSAEFDYSRTLRRTFHSEVEKLFIDHPMLHSICWSQATDDSLDFEFFVNREQLKINSIEWLLIKPVHDLYAAAKDVTEFFFDAFEDNDFLSLFGDHVAVVIAREEKLVAVKTSYYSSYHPIAYKSVGDNHESE